MTKTLWTLAVVFLSIACLATASTGAEGPKKKSGAKPAAAKPKANKPAASKAGPNNPAPKKPVATEVASSRPAPQKASAKPASLFESPEPATPVNQIDKIVFAKLSSLGIEPRLSSDAVFVRRVFLDLTGTLPTAEQARAFITSKDKNKRSRLIDLLMERKEFGDYWSMKWGDVLRIKAEFPVNLWPNAAQAYHHWVRASILENKPYDQFVREMLTSSGSNFRVGPVNFYRAIQNKTPDGIATAVALTFMGARADSWPPRRLAGMAVFFSQVGYKPTSEWKEEYVFWDPLQASVSAANVAPGQDKITTTGQIKAAAAQEEVPSPVAGPLTAVFPDGTKIELSPDKDPREIFADWLIRPENPWFTRCIVNRVWTWLLGRGITNEPDDIREDNPPSIPELEAYLASEFVASGYDMKKLYRLILNSATYQLSAVPHPDVPDAEACFASYPIRRLDAEVLIDAVNSITGTTDLYTSAIPEPFTYIPKEMSAVAIADGSITSPFLTLFGRSARATGTSSERDNNPVAAQWLHMLNSSHIQSKLEQSPKLKALLNSNRKPEEMLELLYLTVLSRFPTPEEIKRAEQYGANPARKTRNDWIDIAWALINNTEFLYRH